MSKIPLVSIIVPTWNGEQVLAETLRSLEAQTFGDFEALIVNDGSTDSSATIVGEFSRRDARFILVAKPHSGLAATRNVGVQQARGSFIAFLDHDDIWLPQKLERQMELFRADPAANFSFTNYYNWDGERDLYLNHRNGQPLPVGDAAPQLIPANVFGMSTVVVRRELIRQAGEFNAEFDGCEDWDMWLRLMTLGMKVCGTREPLMRYRRWPGNLSNQKLKMADGSLRVLEHHSQRNQNPEWTPLFRRALKAARAKLALISARRLLDSAPEKVPAAVFHAWRLNPRDIRWLLRAPLLCWPKALGGEKLARGVHRKLIQKY